MDMVVTIGLSSLVVAPSLSSENIVRPQRVIKKY